MKKWYQWFWLSIVFAVGGAVNCLNGRQITAAVIQVSITVIFAFVQLFCDGKGEKGKKAFKYISAAACILLIAWLIYLVVCAFV